MERTENVKDGILKGSAMAPLLDRYLGMIEAYKKKENVGTVPVSPTRFAKTAPNTGPAVVPNAKMHQHVQTPGMAFGRIS